MTDSSNETQGQVNEAFVQLLTGEQFKLLQYIAMLLGDPDAANNVLQETNLVLWRKADEFTPGTSFSAWARRVAYWQVQAYVRDRRRDRHVFSEQLIEQLANRDPDNVDEAENRVALRHCLKQISGANLQMLRQRYEHGLSIASLSEQLGRTQSAVKVALMRVRRALHKCIEQQLAEHRFDA